MRTTINLATRPYVELGPVVKKLRIAMVVLAVAAVGLGVWVYLLGRQRSKEQAQLDAIHAQTGRLQQERRTNESRMKEPANAAELQRAQFLNDLFAKKAFSWTAVMMDLENVLPPGLAVSSIEPQVLADGTVQIRLHVAGERERAVELVRNLEKSKHFIAPQLRGESSQVKQQQGSRQLMPSPTGPASVEFEIVSGYNPVLQSETAKASAKDNAKAGAKEGAE